MKIKLTILAKQLNPNVVTESVRKHFKDDAASIKHFVLDTLQALKRWVHEGACSEPSQQNAAKKILADAKLVNALQSGSLQLYRALNIKPERLTAMINGRGFRLKPRKATSWSPTLDGVYAFENEARVRSQATIIVRHQITTPYLDLNRYCRALFRLVPEEEQPKVRKEYKLSAFGEFYSFEQEDEYLVTGNGGLKTVALSDIEQVRFSNTSKWVPNAKVKEVKDFGELAKKERSLRIKALKQVDKKFPISMAPQFTDEDYDKYMDDRRGYKIELFTKYRIGELQEQLDKLIGN